MTDPRSEGGAAPLAYMPQLDGLRAFAVSVVVLQHYRVLHGAAAHGVHLFFVLSGFLITRILLKSRQTVSETGRRPWHAFRQFYIRRALRIFPLYYFVILAALILNAHLAREYAPWLLTYTINLKMAAQGWYILYFAHFWSLAVEEQYYLFWPWLILLLPRRWLIPAAVGMTAIGPLYRLYLLFAWKFLNSEASPLGGYIATPTALDSLGMGSLVSILMTSEFAMQRLRRFTPSMVALLVLGFALILKFVLHGTPSFVFYDTLTAVVFAWLIYRASRGFGGITGSILGAAPLIFIGRISYGIYVYHPLVPPTATWLARHLGIPLPTNRWGEFFVFVTLTVIVSSISWYILERPINELKRHFAYDR